MSRAAASLPDFAIRCTEHDTPSRRDTGLRSSSLLQRAAMQPFVGQARGSIVTPCAGTIAARQHRRQEWHRTAHEARGHVRMGVSSGNGGWGYPGNSAR